MRSTTTAKLASVLLLALLGVGCGTAQKAAHQQQATDPATKQGSGGQGTGTPAATSPSTPAPSINPGGQEQTSPPPVAQWELLNKWSDVQGTIVTVRKSGDTLQSIAILVEKDFKFPTSSDTTPDFPFRVGSTADIAFSSTLPTGGVINPKVGDEVVLSVGQFQNTKDEKQPPFWGSSLDRYWYAKDHKFYNPKGEAYQIFTGPDLQQKQVYTQ